MDGKKFQEIKPRILKALEDKKIFIEGEEALDLIDGFTIVPLQESHMKLLPEARSLPLVMLLGRTTGRMYFFALYSLISKKELGVDNE